ncbi:MAG: winged helix-turn-helix domain-containing protein, partial [Noviherbaspirillum sp.]
MGDALLSLLAGQVHALNNAFPEVVPACDPLEWAIEPLPHHMKPENLLSAPEAPSVVLIDACTPGLIDKIQLMEKRELTFVKDPPYLPLILSPVLLVFPSLDHLAATPEFPDFVADWICMPIAIPDLVRRAVAGLRRKNILKIRLRYGPLVLLPESRVISCQDRNIHLTPSEFALAELFLSQGGAVIPISDLVALFKSSGKSTEGSNIRVTVFQLRLKLEMLTRSQFTIVSVYKRGYCLKQ